MCPFRVNSSRSARVIKTMFLERVSEHTVEQTDCREKVAIIAGDAPLLISKPFLQPLGAVLNLEQGQVTFNELGVTLNLEESATGHFVIDLISGCADSITDETKGENAGGSGKCSRNASVEVSEDAVDNSEFSNLICGSEKVTVTDVGKRRASLVGVDCEKSCRRWTTENVVSDNSIFVTKEEFRKISTKETRLGLVAQSLRENLMSLKVTCCISHSLKRR